MGADLRKPLIACVLWMLACHSAVGADRVVTVVRTEYGVAHVRAKDWTGLGFGHGYAAAQDNLCVLADAFVTYRGERARYLGLANVPRVGTIANVPNLEADFFFRHVLSAAAVDRFEKAQPADLRALVAGYAAGYSRYVSEIRGGAEPGRHVECRSAAWLQEAGPADIYRRMYALGLAASSLRHIASIAGAKPPAVQQADRRAAAATPFDPPSDPGLGSNVIGFGGDATGTESGLLFGNPHWYWDSIDRFYQVHLHLPGQIDVEGAAILGVPVVLIGFNNDVAWSHTVSTAARYTVYRLKLAEHDPTSYLYDGQIRHMKSVVITVDVRNDDGSVRQVTRTLYDSHFGPMLGEGWTSGEAFTLRDANAENDRAFENWLRWDRAHSLNEFVRIQREEVAVPWVNTVAVGRTDGRVWYGDVGAIPNVPDTERANCQAGAFPQTRAPTLDGSRSDCEWKVDPTTPQKGIFPARSLPQFLRRDSAANMNDSFWLSNPNTPLTGYPHILGDEGTEQTLRTRLGHILVRDRLAGTDGLEGRRATSAALRRMALNSRNLGAELFLDDVLQNLCPSASMEACKLLARWDRRGDPESVGALIWDRFWEDVSAVPPSERFRVPFDAARPLDTPRGLNTSSPAVVAAFATAVREILASPVRLDAPRAGYQYVTDAAGARLPLAGGCGGDGYFTVICTRWTPRGPAITPHGNSYMQVVGFRAGHVEPYTLLAPSQSTDPASSHYRDYTQAYSRKQWLRAPFTEDEIAAHATETTRLLLSE